MIATSIVAAAQGLSTGVNVSLLTAPLQHLKSIKWQATVLPMALWHAVGSIATIVLRETADDSAAADPVRASAVVGLIAALFLNNNKNKAAALAVYGGSFVGMSLPSRLMYGKLPGSASTSTNNKSTPTVTSLLATFGVAGALGGLVHGVMADLGFWPGGWGGKAGSYAFVGCLVYRGAAKLWSSVIGVMRGGVKE